MGKYDISGGGSALSAVQSTFVDPGLETFKQSAMMIRQNYDKNKETYNLTKRAMAKMELMPGDEQAGLRDQFVNNVDGKFESILSQGNFEDAEGAVQDAVDYVMTDKTILQAQQNSLEFKKEELLIDQFGPSGILDFNKGLRDNFTTVSTDEEGNQTVNSYKEEMEAKEDYNAAMKQLVGTIQSSGWSSVGGHDINGDQIMDYLKTGHTTGVSQSKMERVVSGLLDNYIDGKAGNQDMRRLTQIEGMSEEQARQNIKQRMLQVNQYQVGTTTKDSYQQYKVSDGSGSRGGKGGVGTVDYAAAGMLGDGWTKLTTPSIIGMLGGTESKAIEGGVAMSGVDGFTTDFTKMITEEQSNLLSQELVNSKVASSMEDAAEMTPLLVDWLHASNADDLEEQQRIAAELGIPWTEEGRTELQTVSQFVQKKIDISKLNNMESLLSAAGDGIFVPNTGTSNTEFIGDNAIVHGQMFFTEDQMNNMANQMGLDEGTGGWFFDQDIFGDNLENAEDAQGNPIFAKETRDGVDYWKMKVMSPRQTGGAGGQAWDNLYKSEHSDTQFKDNEMAIKNDRNTVIDLKKQRTDVRYRLNNAIPSGNNNIKKTVTKYLDAALNSSTLLESGKPVAIYQQISEEVYKIASEGYKNQKSADEINKELRNYYDSIFKPASNEGQ